MAQKVDGYIPSQTKKSTMLHRHVKTGHPYNIRYAVWSRKACEYNNSILMAVYKKQSILKMTVHAHTGLTIKSRSLLTDTGEKTQTCTMYALCPRTANSGAHTTKQINMQKKQHQSTAHEA